MEYTNDTQTTARNYNLTPRDVLFCTLIAAGADRAEAYYTIYDHGQKRNAATAQTYDQERTKANEFFNLNPGAAVLVQRLKDRKKINTTEAKNQTKTAEQEKYLLDLDNEELKKFGDKSYIIARLGLLSSQVSGKEQAQILMQIADLQRMKNEENKETEEKRRFYLPFVSHCRSCKLMQLFRDAAGAADPAH